MSLSAGVVIGRVKALGLPRGSFVVIGSGILAALGIRQASDIDLVVDDSAYQTLARSGEWIEEDTGRGMRLLSADGGTIEVWRNWHNPSGGEWTIDDLLCDAAVIDEVAFASLERVRSWKQWRGREKDLRDVALIDAYRKETNDE